MRRKKAVTDKPKKPRRPPPYNKNSVIRGALRRAFARSPIVREVLLEGRREVPKYNKDGSRSVKDAVQYLCETCGEWVSSTKIQVDHVVPVISTNSSVDTVEDWNLFIDRLWCDRSNLSRICKSCHQLKTNAERLERNQNKKKQKLKELQYGCQSDVSTTEG